jgi:hypothetical protein
LIGSNRKQVLLIMVMKLSRFECCPACGHPDSTVMDSRSSPAGLRRRRRCLSCQHRWTTIEVSGEAMQRLLTARALLEEVEEALVAALASLAELAEVDLQFPPLPHPNKEVQDEKRLPPFPHRGGGASASEAMVMG